MENSTLLVDANKVKFINNPEPVDQSNYKNIEESYAKQGARFLGGTAARVAQGAVGLTEIPARVISGAAKLAGAPIQSTKYPSDYISDIAQSLGANVDVKNPIGRAIQYTAENAPLVAATSGLSIPSILKDFSGSLGLVGAENLDLGTAGKLIGSVVGSYLGGKGYNKVANILKMDVKNPSKIKDFVNSKYTQESKLGSNIDVNPNSIQKKLVELEGKVNKSYVNSKKFDESAHNRVLRNIKTAQESTIKPKLTASDIYNENKNINKAYNATAKKSTEGNYYKELKSIFTDEINNIAKNNPEWGKVAKDANRLYEISHWRSNLGNYFDSIKDEGLIGKLIPNPYAQAAAGLMMGAYQGTKAGLITAGLPAALNIGVNVADSSIRGSLMIFKLISSKEGQRVIGDIIGSSAINNSGKLNQSLKRLNTFAETHKDEFNNTHIVDANKVKFI